MEDIMRLRKQVRHGFLRVCVRHGPFDETE